MRTPSELIAELDKAAPSFTTIVIAVAFEETTKFVFATEKDRLEKLKAAIHEGGEAIGMLGMNQRGNVLSIASRPFREYVNDKIACDCLVSLSDHIAKTFGAGEPVADKYFKIESGWRN